MRGAALDLALVVEKPDFAKYHVLKMPGYDQWGVDYASHCDFSAKERNHF